MGAKVADRGEGVLGVEADNARGRGDNAKGVGNIRALTGDGGIGEGGGEMGENALANGSSSRKYGVNEELCGLLEWDDEGLLDPRRIDKVGGAGANVFARFLGAIV